MKVLFATSNPSKFNRYRESLEKHGIELLSLKDIDLNLEIDESGKDAISNAYIKASAYFEKLKIPTIGMDDNLFIDELPPDKQPGTHVRRVNGKELNDDEMIEYYTSLVKEYGGRLTGRWVYGMVVCTDKGSFKYTWEKDNFYFVDTPSPVRNPRYPLNSISVMPSNNKYFSEMASEGIKFDSARESNGVVEFILKSLGIK